MWCVGRSHSGVEIVVVGLDLVVDGNDWLHGALASTEGAGHVLNEPEGIGAWDFVSRAFLRILSGFSFFPVATIPLSSQLTAHLGDGELVSGHDFTHRSLSSRFPVLFSNHFD